MITSEAAGRRCPESVFPARIGSRPNRFEASQVLVNVLGGAIGAGTLLTAAGFTFTRRIGGAWTLCGLCAFYAVANTAMAPLLWGTSIGDQLDWIFGFDKGNGTTVGLATIFGILTAITAAIAGSVTSYEPTTATPPRP